MYSLDLSTITNKPWPYIRAYLTKQLELEARLDSVSDAYALGYLSKAVRFDLGKICSRGKPCGDSCVPRKRKCSEDKKTKTSNLSKEASAKARSKLIENLKAERDKKRVERASKRQTNLPRNNQNSGLDKVFKEAEEYADQKGEKNSASFNVLREIQDVLKHPKGYSESDKRKAMMKAITFGESISSNPIGAALGEATRELFENSSKKEQNSFRVQVSKSSLGRQGVKNPALKELGLVRRKPNSEAAKPAGYLKKNQERDARSEDWIKENLYKGPSIQTKTQFEPEISKRILANPDGMNISDLRRSMNGKVPEDKFNEWLLEMQADQKVYLTSGELRDRDASTKKRIIEGGINHPIRGLLAGIRPWPN